MTDNESTNTAQAKIDRLQEFRSLIVQYDEGKGGRRKVSPLSGEALAELRMKINQESHWARRQVIEAGCFYTVTISPPPIVGGLIAHNVDLLEAMFDPPHGQNLFPKIIDMLDRTVGVLRAREAEPEPVVRAIENIRKNFAFVAMTIDRTRPELDDVLEAIKEACDSCGIQAERIDDDLSNERITDRILQGTPLHFDLKDYPVIFFASYKELKNALEARLRAVATRNQ